MRSFLLLVAFVGFLTESTGAPIDGAHRLMEAALEPARLPRLRVPGRGVGLAALASPRNVAVLVPAVLGSMAVACPDVLANFLVQLICFFGSLFEPFDSVLPERGFLRAIVTTVQRAKKAYNVKHGLVQIDEQQFFDDEDTDHFDDDVDADEMDAEPAEEGGSDANMEAAAIDGSADASEK